MRCVDQRVVIFRPFAALYFQRFLLNLFHRSDEAVELGLAFAFGGLDHQRTGHGERHGRGVEAVVHQALSDVHFGDAAFGLERAQVDDAFVRHAAVFAGVEHRIIGGELLGNVVGVEQGGFGGLAQTVCPHHADVHPSNR